jgi:pimeloyl-ACP methyl ester carboxylesterase
MKSLAYGLLACFAIGCSDGSSNGSPDMATPTLGPAPMLAMACADQAADVYTLPTGLPAMDDTHRGDVFHCAVSESLTAELVNSRAQAYGYAGPTLASGFWTYRIGYRTLRNTPEAGGTAPEGDTAAVVAVPEKPLAGAPLVVFAHGSVGIASGCAPSKFDLSSPMADQDFPANMYELAGAGYTVIMPDYSGFAYGQAPGYFNAEDEAHAVLDATRAAHNLLTTAMQSDKVVIVGHSQGGHAALAAQSYAKSYGLQGTLVGVATWAPFWTSMAAYGAITSPAAMFKTATDYYAIEYAMSYFYSAGELRDGPGHGLDMFQAAKRDAVKQVLVGGACYDNTGLQALGTQPYDFFDNTFVDQVGTACAALTIGNDCTQGAAPTWLARWKSDRPALDPAGAPILIWYGGLDEFVAPGFAQCARDKFATDGASSLVSICYDAGGGHRELVKRDADYVNQWIAARAGIGPEPAACPAFPDGMTCTTPPNNF